MVNKFKSSGKTNANVNSGDSLLTRRLRNISYIVWSVVGIMVIILLSVAIFRSGTWVENLNLADTPQPAEQTQQPPQQQPQPTQEQLDCVSEKLGEKRFEELQQGEQPKPEETSAIQACLQS
ncbi:hypothetical protein KY385_02085 [Candidatus Parcubacteria bacterium]|nr:hypothetical protein [Candidatus Parcubacteria bacterium]